jgi:uncharacterized protein (TIGR00288 family)
MGSPHGDPPVHAPNAAMMIDFDNVTLGIRSDLQSQLRALMNSEIIKGKVAVQRAYADWRRYPQYIVPLSEASIDLIFAPAFGSQKKNATDIRLAIDALELVFIRPEIGVFILLSGDSDFSSLVLKLKEYGKYVIGVGIRESSSDLLIQNCDEYYSYNELTGFTKEGDVEHVSQDPWALVVLAVTQMKKNEDVMRSDRLKQVMQSLDPTFDEKSAGYNRFSKFVVEAQNRGLLALEKLENGQFSVDIGDNANVSPEDEGTFKESGDRGRARPKRRPRSRGPAKRSALSLAEAFDLLREALMQLGATDETSIDAEAVRARMLELFTGDDDPLFERPRFQRLMRQAHDADLIELVKQGEEYVMRLGSTPPASPDEPAASEATPKAPARKRASRAKTTKKRVTKRSKAAADGDASVTPGEPTPTPVEEGASAAKPAARRGTGRSGSRRGTRRKPESPAGSESPPAEKAVEPPAKAVESPVKDAGASRSSSGRSLGPRRGSSRGSRAVKAPPKEEKPERKERTAASTERAAPATPAPTPEPRARSASAPPPPAPPPATKPLSDEDGGLLKRMGAAIQKVMRGPEDE